MDNDGTLLDAGERLKGRLRLVRGREEPRPAAVDGEPVSAHSVLMRADLDHLAEEVKDLRGRVGSLIWGLGGAVVLDVVMRLAGR